MILILPLKEMENCNYHFKNCICTKFIWEKINILLSYLMLKVMKSIGDIENLYCIILRRESNFKETVQHKGLSDKTRVLI